MKANPIIPGLPSVSTIDNLAGVAVEAIEATAVFSVGKGIQKLADTFSTTPSYDGQQNNQNKQRAPNPGMAPAPTF